MNGQYLLKSKIAEYRRVGVTIREADRKTYMSSPDDLTSRSLQFLLFSLF